MKKSAVLLALLLVFGVTAAGAQEVPNSDESYSFILAKLAAEEGHYDEALAKLDAIALKHPDDLVLLYERAMIRIDAGQRDAAEIDLRRAVTTNPNFYDAQRVLGRVILDRAGNDRGKIDDAVAHLQAAHRLNPDDLNSGMAVAQIYIATKRPEEAAKTLAALLERAPDQRAINYNYAQVLTTLGRKDEARQYLEKAVLLDATFGPAILQLVDIYQKEGAWRKAAEMLAPLVKDDPANVDLQRQYAYFLLRSGESEKARAAFKKLAELDPHDTRAQYYLAESLNDLEQFEEADKIYRRLLATSPDDADLLASLGLSQIGQRKYEEARKSFERILVLKDATEPLQMLARTQLAYVELQTGHLAEAVERARPIVIYRDKPNAQAINIAVDALRKEKKYADAVALLQPVAARFSDDPFVTSRYLEMMMRAGDREKAQQLANEQAKMGPKYTVAIAEAYVQNEDYPAAIALLKAAQAANAGDTDLQFALATAYERSGDRATAEKTFLDILSKNPDHGATLNYLGYMWAESGTNLERAAEMLKKAVSQEPRNGAYIDSLGWVYFRQGKLDLAEKYLTDATKLLPRDATVREHLGDVFAKRGDFHRALDLYRNALALEPEPKDEAKLRSKIADVEKQSQR